MTSHHRILLVEDDPLLREAIRLLLEDAGYGVREAGTAAQAIEAIDHEAPSLVLLDLGLPDRSGIDLIEDLKAHIGSGGGARAIPVVALTGRAGAEERRRCLDAGCRDYLVKPVEGRTLLRRIPEFIED